MSNLFQKLELQAFRAGITPRTEESRKWFRQKAQQLRRVNRRALMSAEEVKLVNRQQPMIGSMNMFFYDPKTIDTLPYYDRFPLVIIVGPAPKGFYGLNLHYLPPILRAKLLDALMDMTNNKKYNESTRFNITYKMLTATAKLRLFKPCFKHYLTQHVKSRLARVNSTEWEIATFLPMAEWEKGTAASVYRDSRKMV